jgi:hypothetical protein
MTSESLKNILKDVPSIIVKADEKTKFKSSKQGKELQKDGSIFIPPSKAIINFASKSGKFKTVKKTFKAGLDQNLPEFWTNYTPPPNKDITKYRLSTRPQNQQKCGSCFAFACANAISDCFIFGKNLSFNPNISPMSILSCVKDEGNAQCEGGDVLSILNYIVINGVTSDNCLNYNLICNSSPACYTNVKKAFDEINNTQQMIIPGCGCCKANCESNNEKFSYFITDPYLIAINDSNNYSGIDDGINVIKYHLLDVGATVTGYVVYGNFIKDKTNGRFEKTNGIYIESENYGEDNEPKKFYGCHAVSIVGWGIEKNPIKIGNTILTVGQKYTLKDNKGQYIQKEYKGMPYWIARNSWDTIWGNNGYFKIAMYQKISENIEINPTTSFERINLVNMGGQTYQMGGVLIFRPKFFEKYQKTSSNCSSSDPVYCNEKNPNINYSTLDNSNNSNSNNNGVSISNTNTNQQDMFNKNSIFNSNINSNYIFGIGLILLIYMFYKKYDAKFIYILFLIIVFVKLSL